MISAKPTLRPIAAALALLSLHSIALGQSAPAEPQPAPQGTPSATEKADAAPSAADMLDLNKVIVTGRGKDRAKFTSSYSISTFSEQELSKRDPMSVAALITTVPGLFAESSGGEVGNNVYSRGLPNDNYRYLPLLEDGLPVFEEGAGAFTNADAFFRFDATTRNVQVVRGGTASILANNAPGGSVNVITKKGTETLQGQVKFEVGDYDHLRTDFNISGPISDKVLFQIGGFQRANNGLRDPGFNGNKGGQFRGGLTFKLDDGELYLGLKSLNDRNIFYTAMPMASPSEGLPGLSAQSGTLVSSAFSNVIVPDGQGVFNTPYNIKNGVHTNVNAFTALFDKDLSDTVSIHNKFRRTTGTIDFNGLFSNGVTDAQAFLDSALAQLKAANPATTSAAFRIVGGNGQNFGAAQMPNGLAVTQGLWNTLVDVDNVINDFSIKKTLSTGLGTHDLVFGVYYSKFNQQQSWNWSDVLTQATDRPPLLDVVGLDANGNVTISRTTHGLLNLHTNLQHFTDHVRNLDYYFTDFWQVTKPLSIDGGIRYHTVKKDGLIAQTTTKNLGDSTTIADDSVAVFSGGFTPYSFETKQLAASIGANYEVNDSVAVFARAGKSFRVTPEFAQWFNCCTPIEKNIRMFELGLKYATKEFSTFLTLYYNDFPNLSFNTTTTVNGQQVTQSASASAKSTGLEAEFVWRPTSLFDLAVSGVYQDLKYSAFAGNNPDGTPFSYSGNQIVRQPKLQASIRPSLHFGSGNAYSVYADYRYTGKRYADVANSIVLPGYGELDLGLSADLNAKTRFMLLATNVMNKVGVTEGNPRSGIIQGVQQTAFEGRPIFGRHIRASIEYKF
jgi:outer membrane receptor protein involved in Fe transport